VISVGAESTYVAVRNARLAKALGAAGVMAIPPLSIALNDAEKFGYYSAILASVDIPVLVQDASGYVGQPLSIEIQTRLLEAFPDRAYFKPEAAPIGPRVTELLDATGGQARIFEGTGGIELVDTFARGIAGTMPGGDICWAHVPLWNALQRGDVDLVQAINAPLVEMIGLKGTRDSFLAAERSTCCTGSWSSPIPMFAVRSATTSTTPRSLGWTNSSTGCVRS
jgi:dihydrodipicolinate synthase/N-acetylneuraminate lyase